VQPEDSGKSEGQTTGTANARALPLVPVSWGEILDKITILELKAERIVDPVRRANVRLELATLTAIRDDAGELGAGVRDLVRELAAVNAVLWEVEDALRRHEDRGCFNADFIALARQVYQTNDRRAALKRRINQLTGSTLIEEKSYGAVDGAACRKA